MHKQGGKQYNEKRKIIIILHVSIIIFKQAYLWKTHEVVFKPIKIKIKIIIITVVVICSKVKAISRVSRRSLAKVPVAMCCLPLTQSLLQNQVPVAYEEGARRRNVFKLKLLNQVTCLFLPRVLTTS